MSNCDGTRNCSNMLLVQPGKEIFSYGGCSSKGFCRKRAFVVVRDFVATRHTSWTYAGRVTSDANRFLLATYTLKAKLIWRRPLGGRLVSRQPDVIVTDDFLRMRCSQCFFRSARNSAETNRWRPLGTSIRTTAVHPPVPPHSRTRSLLGAIKITSASRRPSVPPPNGRSTNWRTTPAWRAIKSRAL